MPVVVSHQIRVGGVVKGKQRRAVDGTVSNGDSGFVAPADGLTEGNADTFAARRQFPQQLAVISRGFSQRHRRHDGAAQIRTRCRMIAQRLSHNCRIQRLQADAAAILRHQQRGYAQVGQTLPD